MGGIWLASEPQTTFSTQQWWHTKWFAVGHDAVVSLQTTFFNIQDKKEQHFNVRL